MSEEEIQKALRKWGALEEKRKQKENEFFGPQIPDENGIINRFVLDEDLLSRFAEIEDLREQVQRAWEEYATVHQHSR